MKSTEKVEVTEDVIDEFCSNTEYSESESREIFSFKSDFTEEDIEKCLDELFEDTNIKSKMIIHRDELRHPEHLYTLVWKMKPNGNFLWNKMSSPRMEVFKNLKRIL